MSYEVIGLAPAPGKITGEKFHVRAGAYIIDLLFCYLVSYPVGVVMGTIIGFLFTLLNRQSPVFSGTRTFTDYALSILASQSYFILSEWIYGATLGKYILGMRVIKDNGESCTLPAAIIRGLFRLVDGFLFAIPAMSAMKPPLYKRIGDNAAHTLVVSCNSPAIQEPHPWWRLLFALCLFVVVYTVLAVLIFLSYG